MSKKKGVRYPVYAGETTKDNKRKCHREKGTKKQNEEKKRKKQRKKNAF